ncbi:MAG: PadR family transcriptional regulator [Thermoplasmata archaeon]
MSNPDILKNEFARDFRTGLLKLFILKMLEREDMHGYAMMERIENLSGWKPSSGSMYPALTKLHSARLISFKMVKLRKIFTITKKGREYIGILDANFENGLDEIHRIYTEL